MVSFFVNRCFINVTVGIILLMQVLLLAVSATKHEPVISEATHMPAGLSHLYLGRFGILRVNPPLIRIIATMPAFLSGAKMDWQRYNDSPLVRSEFEVARNFIKVNEDDFHWYFVIARWSCIPFSVLGGYVCFCWARILHGISAGFVALIFWCFCPYILGHASLMTPDAHAAAVGVATVYCFWRWLKRPGWFEAIVVGVVLGVAELCKFTLLIFYPILLVLWIFFRLPEWRAGTISWRDFLLQCRMSVVTLFISVCIINCGYLFEGTFTPLEKFRFQTMMFTGCESLDDVPPEGANRFGGTWLGKLPVPLPANMIQGIDTQRYDFERGLSSYLRGEWADHGWWYYYLYALAVKVPLGTWCLALLAVSVTIFGRVYNAPWRDEMVVLVPGLAILVFVSSQTGFSVHSRYVIPVLPFFFIWISKVARVFEMRPLTQRRWGMATAVVVALTWSVVSSLWVYPHSLSYFNELVGGPQNGGKHLLDSNIDWGQDLLYLKDWLAKHPEVTLDGLAFFGSYPATLAGIPETPYPPAAPLDDNSTIDDDYATNDFGFKPGWYALSVKYLYDRSRQYRYFLDFKPVASAGYSIYIYHITPDSVNRTRRKLRLLKTKKSETKILENKDY